MREIKFKAWDKENKQLVDVDLVGETIIKIRDGEWELRENVILLQYTGLKDKNDKEGFESDILNTPVGKAVIMFGEYSPSMGRQEYHIGFYLKFENEEDADVYRKDLGYWLPRSEIIGNVHDNPELLGGEANA